MQKRSLGKTGEDVTILGLGGFHLVEVPEKETFELVNTYLDEGGNYIETAAFYGDGESERKIGKVMKTRRGECLLTTKCIARDKRGAEKQIDDSLRRLQTDYVDFLFFHAVQTEEDLEQIVASGGAAEAFDQAVKAGKARFIGISGHGHPEILLKALDQYRFDAVMTGFNFFDSLNFPEKENKLLPLAENKGMGIIGMKALADGLLYQYPEESLRYALSLPIDTMVVGCNRLDQLGEDLRISKTLTPMTEQEKEGLFTINPLLGRYVCRFCDKCLPCPEGIDIPQIFRYEGWYDRQIRDNIVRPTPEAALRDRLRFWFGNYERAREAYKGMEPKADACTECGECTPRCPHKIDIPEKLKNAHYKLTKEFMVAMPI